MSKLTPQFVEALFRGKAYDLLEQRDYAIQVEVLDISEGYATIRVLIVDKKTQLPILELARERLRDYDTLTMAEVNRAFEVKIGT